MLLGLVNGRVSPMEFAAFTVAIIFAITVHECSHAYVAWRAGDSTPKVNNRVSLNPIDHLDAMGTLLIMLGGFGWGKPVLVNPMNFTKPRRDNILVAVAGPLSNIITAVVCAGVHHLVVRNIMGWDGWVGILYVVDFLALISIGLALFNMIPVFPLDGHHILGNLLPPRAAENYARTLGGPMGMMALFLIVLTPLGDILLLAPRRMIMDLLGF